MLAGVKNSDWLLKMVQNVWLFQILYILADRNCKSSLLTKSKLWKRGGDKKETSFCSGKPVARKSLARAKAAVHSLKRFKSMSGVGRNISSSLEI